MPKFLPFPLEFLLQVVIRLQHTHTVMPRKSAKPAASTADAPVGRRSSRIAALPKSPEPPKKVAVAKPQKEAPTSGKRRGRPAAKTEAKTSPAKAAPTKRGRGKKRKAEEEPEEEPEAKVTKEDEEEEEEDKAADTKEDEAGPAGDAVADKEDAAEDAVEDGEEEENEEKEPEPMETEQKAAEKPAVQEPVSSTAEKEVNGDAHPDEAAPKVEAASKQIPVGSS